MSSPRSAPIFPKERLNQFPQFRTAIDGLDMHFIHVRSPHPGAVPLVLTHGWSGSVVEFGKVIGPLADPVTDGGDTADAFHVVCPTLPATGASAGRIYWETAGKLAFAPVTVPVGCSVLPWSSRKRSSARCGRLPRVPLASSADSIPCRDAGCAMVLTRILGVRGRGR
jgi:pimeloyl-ACP methyl ester carboxylesterase